MIFVLFLSHHLLTLISKYDLIPDSQIECVLADVSLGKTSPVDESSLWCQLLLILTILTL